MVCSAWFLIQVRTTCLEVATSIVGWTFLTRPAGSVIRGSWGDLLLRSPNGGWERRTPSARNNTVWLASRCHCISKAQGLNAQAKGEVLLSRRNGAAEMHKQRRKHFSAGGMGHRKKRKYFSAGGMGQWKFFFWRLHRGSSNLVVSGYIFWSGHLALT